MNDQHVLILLHLAAEPVPRLPGRLINVIGLDIADGAVRAVRSVINPDKLAHVGPLSPGAARPAGTGPERARPAG